MEYSYLQVCAQIHPESLINPDSYIMVELIAPFDYLFNVSQMCRTVY